MKVLVLAGGRSAERDVSLATGAAVCAALTETGYDVMVLDPAVSSRALDWSPDVLTARIGVTPPEDEDESPIVADHVSTLTPADLAPAGVGDVDLVFIALHGGDGEDGHVQALLDAAGVAYVGSGMLASALAMDKNAAKRIFIAEGIPTPNWRVADRGEIVSYQESVVALGLPLVVKPNAQGSTVGLSIVKAESGWEPALAEAFRWDRRLLVEEFIPGRELTVAILAGEALPVIEIKPSHGIYDYECKYTSGRTDYICPAELTPKQTRAIQEQAVSAFRALGCRDYARVDFRMRDDGPLYCLEVNTLPGMTRTSLVPKAARAAGIEFPQLMRRLCDSAMRHQSRTTAAKVSA
ncbi:MAG TPA: D-alanine--D-alanine ligase [candidate division Zixibacteria bacterium]|jgi:D-alanine-D-alanine ligase